MIMDWENTGLAGKQETGLGGMEDSGDKQSP
jgi:hypothetical protein